MSEGSALLAQVYWYGTFCSEFNSGSKRADSMATCRRSASSTNSLYSPFIGFLLAAFQRRWRNAVRVHLKCLNKAERTGVGFSTRYLGNEMMLMSGECCDSQLVKYRWPLGDVGYVARGTLMSRKSSPHNNFFVRIFCRLVERKKMLMVL